LYHRCWLTIVSTSHKHVVSRFCRAAEPLVAMDNSDWWAADLDVPAELFAMEFVFVDPASGVVDNNKYA